MNGNPDARNTVTTIPPGFLPMPAMVTVPIMGHTADIKPITIAGPVCAEEYKKKANFPQDFSKTS